MKILVTGGAGFIGSNFIHYWLKTHPEDTIINLDKLTYAGNLSSLQSIGDDPRYTFIKGDICDIRLIKKLVSQVSLVVHFAAESHVDRSVTDPASFVRTNVLGTQVLLDACVHAGGVRFHHVSTDEVFGALPLDTTDKFSETTPYNPRSPYSASKAGSDHLVRAYAETFGLPITITNCANNFGPYHYPEKLFPLAITNLLEGKKVPIYGDGKYVRDWLYVEDHCRAIDLVLGKGVIGETYCVGSMHEDIDNKTVVQMICDIINADFATSVQYVQDRPGHDRRYAIDWSKIARLGWQPTSNFSTALHATIDWYKNNRWWWEPIKSGTWAEYYQKQYKDIA